MTVKAKIDQFVEDSDKVHLVVHGDDTTVVDTENGPIPSLAKVIVCTAITVTVNAYCYWTPGKHKACREAFRAIAKDGIGRPVLTAYQAAIIVAALMGFTVLSTWAFFFTSN